MRRIQQLAAGGLIYVAGRLFDIDEKLKSEALEEAVRAGVQAAAASLGLDPDRLPTFVPFRDAGQEELIVADKTRRLFELDLGRLRRTVLLVSYIDGLAKDEGVCFEIGYVYASGGAILLISTDFYDVELPNGDAAPLDPLLSTAATRLIRQPHLATTDRRFREQLETTRTHVLADVRAATTELLLDPTNPPPFDAAPTDSSQEVLLEFGGDVFEWQTLLQDRLLQLVGEQHRLRFVRSRRYAGDRSLPLHAAAQHDLTAAGRATVVVTCTDSDEAPAGTAFLQGVRCALNRPTWMYNSKRTAIRAANDYRSSRNLMLDYSATRTFGRLTELAAALREL